MGGRLPIGWLMWLTLGLLIGVFSAEVVHEIMSAEPTGIRAFWYTSVG
jgi:hypothetical protein